MGELTDSCLDQFNAGNAVAFHRFYERFHPMVFSLVCKLVGDRPQAEDITAETFIKLWNCKGHFVHENSVGAFLRTTARNASIDWIRMQKKEQAVKADFLREQDLVAEADYLQEIKAEVFRLLMREIDQLPSKVRRVFTLAYLDGKSNEEIAVLLGIHNQSVRNHKARALKILRLSLKGRSLLSVLFALL